MIAGNSSAGSEVVALRDMLLFGCVNFDCPWLLSSQLGSIRQFAPCANRCKVAAISRVVGNHSFTRLSKGCRMIGRESASGVTSQQQKPRLSPPRTRFAGVLAEATLPQADL